MQDQQVGPAILPASPPPPAPARIEFECTSTAAPGAAAPAEPHRLVHTSRRWYTAAWDPRGQRRAFRADRITLPQITGPRFTPRDPPGGDAAAYVSRSVSSAAPTCYLARIRLRPGQGLPPSVSRPPSALTTKPTANTLRPAHGAESTPTCSLSTSHHRAPSSRSSTRPNCAEHVLALAGRLTRAVRH